MQGLIEQDAGVVAGEGPTGAVRAFEAGRQAHDQQARIQRTKRRHRRVKEIRIGLRVRGAEAD